MCSNYVHRSTDEGNSWETISPDLTRNDPEKLQPSGGAITHDNSGAEIYCTIFAFRESPHEAGVFWAGSDDGLVHISRDGGKSWSNVTPPQLPEWSQINVIEPSPHDAGTVYVTAFRYKHDDYRPFVFKSNDYGESWTAITNGIPDDDYVRVVREDPNRKGLLYAGTETGLYISFDDGGSWQPFQCNLPVTPIHDLVIKGTDLVAATHGRAFWILDDLTPLYQMHDEISGQAAYLFQPRPTTRFRYYSHSSGQTKGVVNYKMTGPVTVAFRPVETAMGTLSEEFLDAGKNPPDGVIVHYALREAPEDEATLTFLDQNGTTLASFSSKSEQAPRVPVAAGANRFVWNMRGAPPVKLESDAPARSRDARMEAGVAPRVPPGEYRVRLTVAGTTLEAPFVIERDPRLPATDADIAEQFRLKSEIRDRISEVNQALNQIRKLKRQADEWVSRTKETPQEAAVKQAADAFTERLNASEGALVNLNAGKPKPGASRLREKLLGLSGMIDESDDVPTAGAQEVYGNLADQAEEELAKLRRVVADDLATFNQALREAGVPLVEA
ncbi:MAG TPA: hypothetical protein VKU87_07665 [Thermomicrobiaceae bacterium]|nr:hypothetical protein [Thermomicrobiaceae bacterium]